MVAACASIVRTAMEHNPKNSIGRRNWLNIGSHQAAKNIAFMFGLLESCKLNDIDFGIYIEDVLTRIMYGEHVDDSFLPCGYVPRYKEGQDAA